MHWNPVRKRFVQRPEDWPWSSDPNLALDKEQIKSCRIQIDFVHLPESYRALSRSPRHPNRAVATSYWIIAPPEHPYDVKAVPKLKEKFGQEDDVGIHNLDEIGFPWHWEWSPHPAD